jgi:hypothetical protein
MTLIALPVSSDRRAPIARIGLAPVVQLRPSSSPRALEASLDDAIDALTFLLMQADALTRTTALSDSDRDRFAGQVQAYAFALGVLGHPDSPSDAVDVKRSIQDALATGPVDAADLRLLVVPEMDPPTAC